MKPYDRAKLLYKDNPDEFYKIIEHCGKVGAFHSDEDCFVCAYQTSSESIRKKSKIILDKLDTWFIYILAGDPNMAFHYTMKNMKYIAYERFDGNIRLVEKKKIQNLLWRTSLRGRDTKNHKNRFEVGV
tara:strand:+ start:14 stop:400 length:387 start_codon:yes stop_codon:yes gene_type:complete